MSSKVYNTILKLNRLTKDNAIQWDQNWQEPDSLGGMERMVGYVYLSKVEDKYFRLYKLEYRLYTDEDEFTYVPSYRLEFVDINGKGLWKFPDSQAIEELYNTILYKVSGAEDFFNTFSKD